MGRGQGSVVTMWLLPLPYDLTQAACIQVPSPRSLGPRPHTSSGHCLAPGTQSSPMCTGHHEACAVRPGSPHEHRAARDGPRSRGHPGPLCPPPPQTPTQTSAERGQPQREGQPEGPRPPQPPAAQADCEGPGELSCRDSAFCPVSTLFYPSPRGPDRWSPGALRSQMLDLGSQGC